MMRATPRRPAAFCRLGYLLLILLVVAAGCSSKKKTTIRGKVTYKGEPVSVGAIYFHGESDQVGMGNISKDGSFTATDVPVGEVRVSLQVRDPGAYAQQMAGSGADPKPGAAPAGVTSLPAKYSDPKTSGVTFRIDATTKEIEVKLE
jgi:hypothetical protein